MPPKLAAMLAPFGTDPAHRVGLGLAVLAVLVPVALWLLAVLCGVVSGHGENLPPREPAVLFNRDTGIGQ